jgi:hypothetical protein
MADNGNGGLRDYWKKLKKKTDEAEPSEYLGTGYADETAEKIRKRKKKQQEELDEMEK